MNKSQRRFTISSLILGLTLISLTWTNFASLASTNHSPTTYATNTTDQKFKEAFTTVREAEAAGAESGKIKDFVDRLNLALDLTDEAEATTIFDQVKAEASQLRYAALQTSLYRKFFIFAMVPVAALIVTICIHYGLKTLRQDKVDQTMKMKIKEKGNTQRV